MLADTSIELSGKWWLRPASHRTLLVFSETLIYLSYTANGSPAWTCSTTSRLTDGHAALTSPGNGSSAWNCTKVFRLSGGCSAIELRRILKSGRAPRCCPWCLLAPNEAGLLTPSRAFSGNWLRRPDSIRRYAAYETAALPLGYSAIYKGKIGTASRCCPGPARFWRPRCAS